jgi:hypothetical protein
MKRLLLVLSLAAAGCSDSQVVAEVSLDDDPLAGLPVWLLPYDRVALRDSLVQESDEPEPAIPAALIARLDTVRARAEAASGDTLIGQFRAERRTLEARIDSIRSARQEWRDRVYAPLDSLAREREAELGTGPRSDTTDARGWASFAADEGRYWVWTVYVLPEATLEWSVPVTLRGDSAHVALTRENARERRVH